MKNKNLIISIVIFVVLIGGALIAYNYLSKEYKPDHSGIVSHNENNKNKDTQKESTQSEDGQNKENQNHDSSEEIQTQATESAPDFTVKDYDGNSVKLSDWEGKPVVVNFWATWCGPCKTELPAFDELYVEYQDQVEFMMVNLTDGQRETVKLVKEFVQEEGYKFPVYFDTSHSAANAYSVYSIPLTVFIDEEGEIFNAHVGAMDENTLEQYIKELLEES